MSPTLCLQPEYIPKRFHDPHEKKRTRKLFFFWGGGGRVESLSVKIRLGKEICPSHVFKKKKKKLGPVHQINASLHHPSASMQTGLITSEPPSGMSGLNLKPRCDSDFAFMATWFIRVTIQDLPVASRYCACSLEYAGSPELLGHAVA